MLRVLSTRQSRASHRGISLSKRRAALCLLAIPLTLFMAKKIRSESQGSSKKTAKADSQDSSAKSPLKKLSPAAQQWVNTTLAKMSTDEKIGQLLFTTYHGTYLSTDSPAYQQAMHYVNDLHAGGFIIVTHIGPLGIEKSQAYPTAALNNELQAKAKVPLLIGADFERGAGTRLDEGNSFPTNMAAAAAGDPKDAYTMGKITAIDARAAGVHWVYAPVADINNNPENPIINTRSFGEDPARVSEFVREYVRGVEENGGLATAKHFPG